MLYILLAIGCSVLVSVLLKLARRHGVDVGQAVAWNYVATSALTAWVFHPSLDALARPGAPWIGFVGLGLLLPVIFLALAASVRHAGIVRSDAAQRLSLIVSLLAAFLLFGEAASAFKLAGIGVGLVAMACMVWRGGADEAEASAAWWWPLIVFVGFAAIDILFKHVAQAGLLLGLANFGNIVFYVRAHQALADRPSLVFAAMNLGVVALGALVGTLAFREKLSRLNLAGVALAAVAIVLATRG